MLSVGIPVHLNGSCSTGAAPTEAHSFFSKISHLFPRLFNGLLSRSIVNHPLLQVQLLPIEFNDLVFSFTNTIAK